MAIEHQKANLKALKSTFVAFKELYSLMNEKLFSENAVYQINFPDISQYHQAHINAEKVYLFAMCSKTLHNFPMIPRAFYDISALIMELTLYAYDSMRVHKGDVVMCISASLDSALSRMDSILKMSIDIFDEELAFLEERN